MTPFPFFHQIGDATRIGDSPLAYPERYRGNRRAMLRRFPYVVWYRVEGEAAIVLACVHGDSLVPVFARASKLKGRCEQPGVSDPARMVTEAERVMDSLRPDRLFNGLRARC